mmetsp:Transcript_17476/g.39576  ORF Transcript_17476/g.39576 Transcript_17476/m.39576 type:complete len:248 (-) Transcript_17476:897-1640(-)
MPLEQCNKLLLYWRGADNKRCVDWNHFVVAGRHYHQCWDELHEIRSQHQHRSRNREAPEAFHKHYLVVVWDSGNHRWGSGKPDRLRLCARCDCNSDRIYRCSDECFDNYQSSQGTAHKAQHLWRLVCRWRDSCCCPVCSQGGHHLLIPNCMEGRAVYEKLWSLLSSVLWVVGCDATSQQEVWEEVSTDLHHRLRDHCLVDNRLREIFLNAVDQLQSEWNRNRAVVSLALRFPHRYGDHGSPEHELRQ